MREAKIEKSMVSRVSGLGGLCWKWVSPGTNGVPDRIILFPGGRIIFCELKAPGEKPRPLQLYRKKQLEGLGFEIRVVDSMEGIENLIREEMDRHEAASVSGIRQGADH